MGRQSRRGAGLAGVSGWVTVGPRKAAGRWDRGEVAEGCLEAQAYLVAEQGT